jgi:hypothetical protein
MILIVIVKNLFSGRVVSGIVRVLERHNLQSLIDTHWLLEYDSYISRYANQIHFDNLLSTRSHTMVNHVELNKKAFVPFQCLFDIIVPSRDGTYITFLTRYIFSK